jgi:hypothetical protein
MADDLMVVPVAVTVACDSRGCNPVFIARASARAAQGVNTLPMKVPGGAFALNGAFWLRHALKALHEMRQFRALFPHAVFVLDMETHLGCDVLRDMRNSLIGRILSQRGGRKTEMAYHLAAVDLAGRRLRWFLGLFGYKVSFVAHIDRSEVPYRPKNDKVLNLLPTLAAHAAASVAP